MDRPCSRFHAFTPSRSGHRAGTFAFLHAMAMDPISTACPRFYSVGSNEKMPQHSATHFVALPVSQTQTHISLPHPCLLPFPCRDCKDSHSACKPLSALGCSSSSCRRQGRGHKTYISSLCPACRRTQQGWLTIHNGLRNTEQVIHTKFVATIIVD